MVSARFFPVLAGLLVLAGGGIAVASPQFRQTWRGGLSETQAATPTGAFFGLEARDPGAPFGQPKAMTRIVARFPPGTVHDPRGALRCTMPPRQAAQCPDASRVGGGLASTHYGELGDLGGTFDTIEIYLRRGGLYVVVLFDQLSPLRGLVLVWRANLSKRGVLSMPVPALPAPPGRKAVFTRMRLGIGAKPRLGRNLLTTPSKCVPRKGWRSTITVSYEEGPRKTLGHRQKCLPSK